MDFQVGHPPLCATLSVRPSFRPSGRLQPNRTSKYRDFWYVYVKSGSQGGFFLFLENFEFSTCYGVKRVKKWPKNDQMTYISESALRIFLKLCSVTKYYKRVKMLCLSFPKKSWFWGKWAIQSHFGPKLRNLISQDPLDGFF